MDSQTRPKILAVDDEDFNLDILGEILDDAGYNPVLAVDGREALALLDLHPDIEVIVLDRMMPNMDGMACLSALKAEPRFRDIPVIMQTAAASHDQVRQGIEAGVFYYLTKPYAAEILLSLVRSALDDARRRKELLGDVRRHRKVLGLLQHGTFRFRTLEDARNLAVFIANCFPEPERVVYGLSELMINAVEHGNLGISYAEKTKLVVEGEWEAEVDRRLALADQAQRFAELTIESRADEVSVCIEDKGAGFAFQSYLELSPERATDPHGRGIATARLLSFDTLVYEGKGNRVRCVVNLSGEEGSSRNG
ncbi:response regulator [Asticcacaulis sp. AC402]|uniref:response regulator n=1 Tax=Asticcacaulis sp. AC402 TaxID=1282361 RepID=UPI0003C3D8E6|nr:response regulator [Asticcacaulis sp. AC402]ESQ77656.1 histidine kinase [Asticcacaulis sp. AC402]